MLGVVKVTEVEENGVLLSFSVFVVIPGHVGKRRQAGVLYQRT